MKTHNPISVILALLTALPPTGLAIPTYGPLGYAFRLQTHVTRGADYFEGLFVSSFHTGAGQSDLVATKNRTLAPKWLITANATLQRDRGPGAGSAASFDWHAVLTPSLGYEGWMPVTLQAGTEASKGFSLAPQDGTPPVLTWTANETEADASAVASTAVDEDTPRAQGPVTWLVCDWSHGVPQVFYRFKDPRRVPPYMTCADVKLRVVYDIDQSLNVKDDVNE